MNYIIFKADGSINEKNLAYYIQQGNTGVDTIFVSKADIEDEGSYTCQAFFKISNGTTNTLAGVWTANVEYKTGVTASGWLITLTTAQTTYNGLLQMSISLLLSSSNLLTYPVALVINETGYQPDADSGVTIEEINSYLVQLQSYQLKYDLANVRGYNTLALATADLPNLADGQIVIIRDGGSSIYQVQAGELVDLIVNKATSDGLGNVIKDSYVSAVYPTYNTTTDKLFIETYSVEDVLMANNEVILPKATTTKNGLMAKEDKVKVDGFQSQIDSKQSTSEKNQANGYVGLDSNAKIPTAYIPDSILGQLEYQGVYNCSVGVYPTPIGLEKGWFYICSVGGTIGGKDYLVGDWLVYNGATWDKVDNTDAVTSVNGMLGAVFLYGSNLKVKSTENKTIEQNLSEIETRISSMLALRGLQETAIAKSGGGYEFTTSDTLPVSALTNYQWTFIRFFVSAKSEAYYTIIKPSEVTDGNKTLLYIQRGANYSSTRYAQVGRSGDNVVFSIVNAEGNVQTDVVVTAKIWGIKLANYEAVDVVYDNTIKNILTATNLQEAVDELTDDLSATQVDLQNQITDLELALYGSIWSEETLSLLDLSTVQLNYANTYPVVSNQYLFASKAYGNTIVWNQKVRSLRGPATFSGITFTNNGDNSITISGTATAYLNTYIASIGSTGTCTIGHKYIVKGFPIGGSSSTWAGRLSQVGDIYNGKTIFTATTTGTIGIIVQNGATVNITFKPMVFDLTQMFGVGNEPTTIDDFEAIYPNEYYDYNNGKLKSSGVTGLKTFDTDGTTEIGSISLISSEMVLKGTSAVHDTLEAVLQEDETYNLVKTTATEIVTYTSGDESNSDYLTDYTNTLKPLATPTIENYATGITESQLIALEKRLGYLELLGNTNASYVQPDIDVKLVVYKPIE